MGNNFPKSIRLNTIKFEGVFDLPDGPIKVVYDGTNGTIPNTDPPPNPPTPSVLLIQPMKNPEPDNQPSRSSKKKVEPERSPNPPQAAAPSTPQKETPPEEGDENLNNKNRFQLVNLLLDIPSIADRGRRNAVIKLLPKKIKTNVADDLGAKMHVLNIVNTCLRYSNGMQKLNDVLRFFEENSIPMQKFEQALTQFGLYLIPDQNPYLPRHNRE